MPVGTFYPRHFYYNAFTQQHITFCISSLYSDKRNKIEKIIFFSHKFRLSVNTDWIFLDVAFIKMNYSTTMTPMLYKNEPVNNVTMKLRNEREASSLHHTSGSLFNQANIAGSFIYNKPLRPLSAYNIYFQLQRERILEYGIDHKEHEAVPFTIQDIEQVVHERYLNWAGIAPPSATTNVASKKKKKNVKIPSFGELSSQIGLSWKKLDTETKKLFESYANGQRIEYNKINVLLTNEKIPFVENRFLRHHRLYKEIRTLSNHRIRT